MFLGQYEHTIDDKGRMTIPARYRDLIQDGAYITSGFDHNLMILTNATFERLYARMSDMNMADPATRQVRRLVLSNAARLEVDRAGRALIPQYLRDAIQLGDTAIVVGVGEYFEVWSPELWSQQNTLLNDPEANAHRFAALDLSI